MILVFSTNITTRLKYILQALAGDTVLITDDSEKFKQTPADKKIWYSSSQQPEQCYQVSPHPILFETDIRPQNTDCFDWDGLPAFFRSEGQLPFDILAASFFLLTRYEEYLPHKTDAYGRFSHTESLAFKENFLHLPLIHQWWERWLKIPVTGIKKTGFQFTPTYDIDIAYCYIGQPLWINALGFYRDLLKGNMESVFERGNVYSGRMKDPYDVFDWLNKLHLELDVNPIYFFLLAAKRKGVDKNIAPSNIAFKKLVQDTANLYKTGIHPSWQSSDVVSETKKERSILIKEISVLSTLTGKTITKSRQHYLRFSIPLTFRRLIAAGIEEEYSMGYGGINGFRASFTVPFKWFDLEKNLMTDLVLYPFCFMDATAIFNLDQSVGAAAADLQYYHDIVHSVKGNLITLFHNHFLTEQSDCKAWRELYYSFLKSNFSKQ